MSKISFGSDNHSGVHPEIIKSMLSISEKYAPSYDTDDESIKLKKWIQKNWGSADAHLVFNGTAANVLAISSALRSHHAVLCTDVSHLYESECGAPEKFIGVKLIPVPHQNGKLSVKDLSKHLVRRGDQHSNQIKMISITQPTELGTVYTFEELQALRDFCDKERLLLHIDGARLGNACYFLKCDFKDILKLSDVATVGGTKNGLLFGELVVIQRQDLNQDFKFIRKQAMQLPSKTRFMASAFLTYLTTGLWRSIAEHQHLLAKKMIEALPSSITPRYPVESNAVFCCFPKSWIKPLREEFFFYVWDEHTFECRLMTSFSTTQEEIDLFATKLKTMTTEVNDE